jgi:NADP-dependent 3-hydroxy acid dehydrogenase YdfG
MKKRIILILGPSSGLGTAITRTFSPMGGFWAGKEAVTQYHQYLNPCNWYA